MPPKGARPLLTPQIHSGLCLDPALLATSGQSLSAGPSPTCPASYLPPQECTPPLSPLPSSPFPPPPSTQGSGSPGHIDPQGHIRTRLLAQPHRKHARKYTMHIHAWAHTDTMHTPKPAAGFLTSLSPQLLFPSTKPQKETLWGHPGESPRAHWSTQEGVCWAQEAKPMQGPGPDNARDLPGLSLGTWSSSLADWCPWV